MGYAAIDVDQQVVFKNKVQVKWWASIVKYEWIEHAIISK